MKKKFESGGMEFTVKLKSNDESGCNKCAFRGNNPLCGAAQGCDGGYFKVIKVAPVKA